MGRVSHPAPQTSAIRDVASTRTALTIFKVAAVIAGLAIGSLTERLLRRYVASGPDDYEANYFLGEALTALKRPTAAVPFYRTALSQLRHRAGRGDAAIQTEANLLNRLGKVDDAVALFEGLRKRRPADRQLKADYASMLIENGRLPEARRVLALP